MYHSNRKKIVISVLVLIALACGIGVSIFTLRGINKNQDLSSEKNVVASNTMQKEPKQEMPQSTKLAMETCLNKSGVDVRTEEDITTASVVIPNAGSVEYIKNRCLYVLALRDRDSRICDSMVDTLTGTSKKIGQSREQCRNVAAALAVGDTASCKAILHVDQREDCYRELARIKSDATICSHISPTAYARSLCYGGVAAEKQDISLCENLKNPENKADCYEKVAVASRDPAHCANIPSGWSKAREITCIAQIAVETKKIELCDRLYGGGGIAYISGPPTTGGGDGKRDDERNECMFRVGRSIADKNFCDGLKDGAAKDECYHAIAVATKDSSICGMIKGRGEGQLLSTERTCYEDVSFVVGPSACVSLPTQQKEWCTYWSAILTGDISACKTIKGTRTPGTSSGEDQESCYGNAAFEKKDPKLCETIEDQKNREACYRGVAFALQDPSLCRGTNSGECEVGILLYGNNIAACKKFIANTTGTMRGQLQQLEDTCDLKNMSQVVKSEECDKITDTSIKNICNFSVAQNTQDAEKCERVTKYASRTQSGLIDHHTKDGCYACMAEHQANPTFCVHIDEQETKRNCYWNSAVLLKDQSICNAIEGPDDQKKCKENTMASQPYTIGICPKDDEHNGSWLF